MSDKMTLDNPNAKMVPGEYYGLVCQGPSTMRDQDKGSHDVIYNIDLIRYDLPERMRYIKAVSETEYEWADRDPGVTHRVSDVRGLSVRYDRVVPSREVDGLYVSDPFASDEPVAIKKQLKKNAKHRAESEAKEQDLNLAV